MTPAQLRTCLDTLAWTKRGVARMLGRSAGTVHQWEQGQVRIPASVATWLETLAQFHKRHPPPPKV